LFILENKEEKQHQEASISSSTSSTASHEPKSGVLLIRVCEGQNISPPSGVTLPTESKTPIPPAQNRNSLTRKQHWWLPYVVLEFDKNEVLIDALAGDCAHPVYQYRAHL
jgi:serum/glucocorticoid-regulated kinase 2